MRPTMKKLMQAPNLALATLWADQLSHAGIDATVQRAFTSSIAGELPPDQCLPEVWVADATRLDEARRLMFELQHLPERRWACPGCSEIIDGPFTQCWQCGAMCPP